MTLSKRQSKILEYIIKEFFESAEPVGSLTLSRKYDIDLSPATLRSEMSKLSDEGYLYKEHVSSGRSPTTLAIRYFLDELLEEQKLNARKKALLKEQMFQKRFERAQFIKEAVKALSDISEEVAISIVDGTMFISGIANLITHPEFEDVEILKNVLNIIENENRLNSLFNKYVKENEVVILIGDEMKLNPLNECSFVCSSYNYFRGEEGYLAVMGPKRMRYEKAIPAVRTISKFIEDSIAGWQ